MSVETNQDELLKELKEQALDLGITFRDNIGADALSKKIEDKEAEIASQQKAKKEIKVNSKSNKIKVVIESREGEDAPLDQFFGFHSMETGVKENILVMFGEEVEISEDMYNHIKSITFNEKASRMINDADGVPRKEWYNKKKQRFIISKV